MYWSFRVFLKQTKIFSKGIISQTQQCRHYSCRRALFNVPGNDLSKLESSLTLKVDSIVFDCEHSVLPIYKDEARKNIRNMLENGPVTTFDPEWCVRVNPVQAPEQCKADLEEFLSAKNLPPTLCLPKVNNTDQLQWFGERVKEELEKRPEGDRGPLNLILVVETPLAVLGLEELCKTAFKLSESVPIVPVALCLGIQNLTYTLGVTKSISGIEFLHVRQHLVLVAKAFGLQAIDMEYLDGQNYNKFQENCADAAILGFNGKQVLNLDQIVIAQKEFFPSRSKIQWAKVVLKAYNTNQEKGGGECVYQDLLIDNSAVKEAENTLNVASAAGISLESKEKA